MRLIAQFEHEEEGRECAFFLEEHNIETLVEVEGQTAYVWIKNEDDLASARKHYKTFLESPRVEPIPASKIEVETEKPPFFKASNLREEKIMQYPYRAPFTRFFIALCLLIFVFGLQKGQKEGVVPTFSGLERALFYDDPLAYQNLLAFQQKYAIKTQDDLKNLSLEGQMALREINKQAIWPGIYGVAVDMEKKDFYLQAPLFGSIRAGEIWRLFSPILVHASFLHLLFNMLWLWVLGKAVEFQMRGGRYLLFIGLAALVTNTLQYLMIGFFFMGFSGVICALGGYIWVRKKRAPWEIYEVDRSALIFLGAFIFGMAALQVLAFFLQIFHIYTLPIGLANTAHISGAFLGMALGHLNMFTKKTL
jgi:GlpG protein